MSAHATLREATREAHERLDAHFSALDLAVEADYRTFLAAHAAAFLPVEAALVDAPTDWLPPGWRERRRSDALIADCEAMGIHVGPAPKPFVLDDRASAAGALYVLEGSRLGAKVLAGRIGADLPRAFLTAPAPKGVWRTFTQWLDAALPTQEELDAASRAATTTFALFEGAGQGVFRVE